MFAPQEVKLVVQKILKQADTIAVLQELFSTIPKVYVRHSGKNVDYNMGEVSVVGTTTLIDSIGCLQEADMFVDIGSGLGNVVAHVALQTPVGKVLGIEIRRDVALLGQKHITKLAYKYTQLHKVDVMVEDVRTMDVKSTAIKNTSILFSNNILFQPSANLAMEKIVLQLANLRVIVLGIPFCARHRQTCTREFCLMWELKQTIALQVTWTDKPVDFLLFRRRTFE